MKDQKTELERIWGKDYMNDLPPWVEKRGYCYAVNTKQKDILITGMNPSYCGKDGSFGFDFQDSVRDGKLDGRYWHKMRKMLVAPGIDLRPRAAYLDIFYFRHTTQDDIKKVLIPSKGWVGFATDQLTLTRDTIENIIKPKLIVIANKGSYAYWGKEEKFVWMGYKFEKVAHPHCKGLYEITGFRSSPDRIAKDLTDTQLKSTRVVLSKYSWTGAVYPSATLLHQLLA
jgi:hypothetical protein